jgi:hypothetical protein
MQHSTCPACGAELVRPAHTSSKPEKWTEKGPENRTDDTRR